MHAPVVRSLRFLDPRERVLYGVLVITRMMTGLLDVAGIVLIGFVASALASRVSAQDSGEPVRLLGVEIPVFDDAGLFTLVAAVLGLFTAKAVLAVLLTRTLTFFVARVETRAADVIAEHLLRGSLASIKQRSAAEVQYALAGSTTYAFTGLLNNVAVLVAEAFLLIVIASTFFVVDTVAALFTFLYFAVFVVILQLLISRTLRRAAQEAVAGTVDTMSRVTDAIGAFREIAVLNKQAHFVHSVGESRRRIARSGATMTFVAAMPRYVVETALILGVVLLLGQQLWAGELESGVATVGVFLTGGVRLMASLLPLQSALANLKQNSEQGVASLDLLDEAAAEKGERERVPASLEPIVLAVAPEVVVSSVTHEYPGVAGRAAVADIDLVIPAGSFAAIIGPSGAGKTTLVDLILGLLTPTSGTVRVADFDPGALCASSPGTIAYVPQKPGLVSGSIVDNVALGVPAHEVDVDRVHEVLRLAFLEDFVAGLDEGVNTSVGKQADSLSGGQVQRIGLARALYSRPRLLVLDEATSGLDASSEAFIAQSLRSLHGEATVIVVAHRLSTVQTADVVHVIEEGRLTATGTFSEVSEQNPTVAEYVRLMTFE